MDLQEVDKEIVEDGKMDSLKFDKSVCGTCPLGAVCLAVGDVAFTVCMRCGRKYAVPSHAQSGNNTLKNVYRVDHCPMSEGVRRDATCVSCVREVNQWREKGRATCISAPVSPINWEAQCLRRVARRAKYVLLD